MSSLTGKTAFISGGSRGIGLAIAKQLAVQGVNVMIASSNEDHLASAITAIKAASSVKVEGHLADLRTLLGCEATFRAHALKFAECDILVHSAGATKGGVFPTQPDEDFIDGFALKFHAGVRLSRLFWPMLKETRGNVVMVVGGAARTPDHTFMVGSAVNAALANYSKALAGQGLVDDVNVNWVS
ncbi:MAG: SDR family NAD(P)-dependent oxidoreductase, partial [Paracoccaceae bacterium]|nr:SDR family NAD(P)-dependent oxidoreductase [Paracoccaceae bacterium]